MGNICRSPSAEGFFARALQGSTCKNRVSIDSAGTHSYHLDMSRISEQSIVRQILV
jgi:protein-tyrosine phosphatase